MASSEQARRILVVDDEPALRMLVRRVLEQKGYAVEDACDGKEGLVKIEAFHPDLVILDLMMPVMDGWEVLDRLRQRLERPPVMILSAFADRPRALKAGAVECLSKPFSLGALRDACERVLTA